MGTVTKALTLLTYFSKSRPEIGLSDLARLSGQNKATTYRLLGELQAEGFVEQAGAGRAYRLGAAFLHYAALREAAVPLVSVAQGVLEKLSAATGETAHLTLLQGTQLSAVAYAYSPAHATKVTMDDADVLPLHATSSGYAVLAFSPEAFVEEILAAPLPARTSQTQTDPAALRRQLAQVRAQGLSETIGTFEADAHSHAAPIFDASAQPIGAISVAAPTNRVTPQTQPLIRQALALSAADLTRRLGGFVPDTFPTGFSDTNQTLAPSAQELT